MHNKKVIIPVFIILTAALLTTIYIFNFTTILKTPVIGFYHASPENYTLLLNLMKDSKTGYGKEPDIVLFDDDKKLREQFMNSRVDLLITENITLDDTWSKVLLPIKNRIMDIYPKSTKAFSLYNGKFLQLPLQLDHVEFAYKKKYIAGAPGSGLIFSFSDLESQLLSSCGTDRYPLMIAGNNDRDLLDAISVLALSQAGVDGYRHLMDLYNSDISFDELVNSPLRDGVSFADILAKLAYWKKTGIIHPEWLRMTRKEVISFLEDDISYACIMRLSTHRTLSNKLLDQLAETPFPFLNRQDRASGLIMPGYSLAFNQKNRFPKKTDLFIRNVISNENQKKLTSYSGLAPVTTVSEAMDRQSSNARLWGAASRQILPPLPETKAERLSELRNYIQSR